MRYSIEPRDQIYVKGYGILSFEKDKSNSLGKNPSSKYGQKLLDTQTNHFETGSKKAIQKTEEATGHLNKNKISKTLKRLLQLVENQKIPRRQQRCARK